MILLIAQKRGRINVLNNKKLFFLLSLLRAVFDSTMGFASSAADKTRKLELEPLEPALLQSQFTFYCRLIEFDCLSMDLFRILFLIVKIQLQIFSLNDFLIVYVVYNVTRS